MRLFALLTLLISPLWCVDFHDFDAYQHQLSYEQVREKIETYLRKSPQICTYYYLTQDALYLGKEKVDYVLYLTSTPSAPSRQKKKLSEAKIALDPGHLGGACAHFEHRYVKVPDGDREIDEGTLTYLTALELKSLLESEGAEVFITRPGVGQGALAEDFFTWWQKHPELNREAGKIFRAYYNHEDLRARAALINNFAPDITLIIHYNIHECSKLSPLTRTNYNLVFIPGAFCAYELDTPEARYEFLRLIVTDTLAESLKLSRHMISQLSEHLGVPPISDKEPVSYTHTVSLKLDEGIYARNLALIRLVHSPLCYGESLIQNNEEEMIRLSTQDTEIAGVPCSKRLKQVARAYFEGIKAYFGERSD